MHAQKFKDPVLQLRSAELRGHLGKAGCTNLSSQAEYLGLTTWNLSRLLNAAHAPGEQAIARILAAFPDHSFADFFEVVERSRSRHARRARKAVA